MKNNFLTQIVNDLEEIKLDSEKTFGSLNSEQINWKPSPDKWSIGQNFDHLLVTNEKYFPELKCIVEGKDTKTFWKKIPLFSKFWGNYMIRSFGPKSHKKFKVPVIFVPSNTLISSDIVNDFVTHQDTLIGILISTDVLDYEKIKITSPVEKFIIFSLKDFWKILVLHEQRHFSQGENILLRNDFPK